MIPGSDLLSMALTVIDSAQFDYYPFSARKLQPNGQYLNLYSFPLSLQGSAQAVRRELYQRLGLQFDKYYYTFFVQQNTIDVSRDVAGDMIYYQGNMYQCQSITPWYGVDGWVEILTVKVQNIPLVNSILPPPSYLYSEQGQLITDENGDPIIVNQLTGPFITGQNLILTVTFNQPVIVTNAGVAIQTEGGQNISTEGGQVILTDNGPLPFLKLAAISGTINGNMIYSSGSGTPALTFIYTVIPQDNARGLTIPSPIVGAITNQDGTIPANGSFMPLDLSGVNLN